MIRVVSVEFENMLRKAEGASEISVSFISSPVSQEIRANTALLDGVRKIAMDVRELDIDLIDRINPFEAAYAILARAMSESTLKQVAAVIQKKKVSIPYEEARDLAVRAFKFKQERGRAPDITSQDPWEKRLAEGVAALARFTAQAKSNG